MREICLLFIGLTLNAATAFAQDKPVLIGVGVGGSTQGEGQSDSPYLGPPFGGTAFGAIVFVDGFLNDTWTIGGEITMAGDLKGNQSQRISGGSRNFESVHHDVIMSAAVKGHSSRDAAARFGGGGGFGLARRDSERTGTTDQPLLGRPSTPFEQTLKSWAPEMSQ
jgi:hypothetical protein